MKKKSQHKIDSSAIHYFEGNNTSFTDIVILIVKNIKIIIFIPTFLCLITIFYVLFFQKPIYKSTSKIMSSTSSGNTSKAFGIAAQFGINLPNLLSEPKWVYPEIIKSRTLAKIMLKRSFDSKKFGNNKSLLKILTVGNDQPMMGMDTLEIIAIENFLSMISISEDPKTSILTLSIEAFEPRLASDINKALIEELDTHQRKYNKAKTSEAKQFIEERILDTEKELMAAEEDLKDFMARNRRIENSPALQLAQQRLGREVTVLIGVFTTLKQQLETTKIEEVKESDYVIVLDLPEIPIKSSNQNKKSDVILSGVIGIFLGVIISFFMEHYRSIGDEDLKKINIIRYSFFKSISDLNPFK